LASEARRIVSLLPSATEILGALGLANRIVGISHSCDYPPEIADRQRLSRPTIDLTGLSSGEIDLAIRTTLRDHGSVYEVDVDRIAALAPDLIITQGICDVCAVPEQQVMHALARLPSVPTVLTLDAHDLAAIFQSIEDVGAATGTRSAARRLVAEMRQRIEAVRRRTAGRERPRVLALEWLDPPYAPGHWVPELVSLAGGELLAGTVRRPSYRMEWSELRALEPDLVLIMPCGLSLEETRREAARYNGEIERLGGRVHLLDASAYFSRSGPRIVDGLEILESAIFPM
jgi:iron complex transport system substrate-binding protein